MRALFLINARSGRGRDIAVLEQKIETASRAVSWSSRIEQTRELAELDDLLNRPDADEVDLVYAVGGDGTASEIGRRLIGSKRALGILPTGSGNGLARHLTIPMNLDRALGSMGDHVSVSIDTATVNSIPFLGTFGVGFDALVADRFARAGTRGIETYIREALKAFISYQPESYEIEVDGERVDERAFVIAVANSNQYGNDARIAPLASLRDGLLDVAVLKSARLIDTPDIIQRLFRGTLRDCSYITSHRGRRIVIRREQEGAAHIDGEPLILPRELVIEVQARSLTVWVPREAAERI